MKLCLAIPYYGAAPAQFIRSLISVIQAPPCPLHVTDIIGDSLVPRARNTLAARFLATDCDALLFIDSDIPFHPDHVARIISHDLHVNPCIGGLYPKKKPQLEWVVNAFESSDGDNIPPGSLLPVKYTGTGFLLVTRALLLEIAARWPDRAYQTDSDELQERRFDYFPIGPRNLILPDLPGTSPGQERYLSEDWAFCELVRALGHPVVVDTAIHLRHHGSCTYPIDPADVLPAATKTAISSAARLRTALTNCETITAPFPTLGHDPTPLTPLAPLLAALNPDPTTNTVPSSSNITPFPTP